ncbi:unnamed protein product [Schistocephalus solidus]|uniref:PAP_fibrillin domain-containing protein n=1 Tax=Schistocephalus solidus TaxID=70667 RepID=A0A183T7T0_SCHSO|nr:unnamed protein product [Schistocephalus solidus]
MVRLLWHLSLTSMALHSSVTSEPAVKDGDFTSLQPRRQISFPVALTQINRWRAGGVKGIKVDPALTSSLRTIVGVLNLSKGTINRSLEVDSLVEAVDQRSALAETPPPVVESLSTTSTAALVVAEATFGAAAKSTPRTQEGAAVSRRLSLSSAALGPSRRSSAGGGGGQVRRFRTATFTLARVIETSGPRIRVRLVGTDDRNDCWFLVDSDQIRPYPSGEPLQPPFGYVHNHLVWHKTLKKATEEGRFAPAACFITVSVSLFCPVWGLTTLRPVSQTTPAFH